MDGKGPQSSIDPALKIEEADIVIGIFNMRIGTQTKEAASGTVHELQKAILAREKNRKPEIMVYFRETKANNIRLDESRDSVIQLAGVYEFQRKLEKLGIFSKYKNVSEFGNKLRLHLLSFIEERYGERGVFVWGSNDGWRIESYQDLRGKAKRLIRVLGIGACNVTRNRERIFTALDRGVDFRLLIIDPEYFRKLGAQFSVETGFDWDQYFCVANYTTDVRNSLKRAKALEEEQPGGPQSGSFHVKTYSLFLPWNITIADGGTRAKDGEMLVEYCIPSTDVRLGKHIVEKREPELFEKYSKYFDAIWKRANNKSK
jgi:hypothetical protein